jgi:hypothetical protein
MILRGHFEIHFSLYLVGPFCRMEFLGTDSSPPVVAKKRKALREGVGSGSWSTVKAHLFRLARWLANNSVQLFLAALTLSTATYGATLPRRLQELEEGGGITKRAVIPASSTSRLGREKHDAAVRKGLQRKCRVCPSTRGRSAHQKKRDVSGGAEAAPTMSAIKKEARH